MKALILAASVDSLRTTPPGWREKGTAYWRRPHRKHHPMNSPAPSDILDAEYRKMVSDAAGQPYLDSMTADCLQQVQAFIDSQPAPGEETRSPAHRLAGGTATVGLPSVAAALKALEKACATPPADDAWQALLAGCAASLQAAQAALEAEASTRSSL